MQERMVVPVHMAKQETALMQKAWSEEVSSELSFKIILFLYLTSVELTKKNFFLSPLL